mmetsp:Transcript_30129/g.77715  ORF Transcript_30129/g.77715 Transcript_30129/m.77715 type:complete len:352 (+) Transcript_30129:5371-6426(+)
MITWWKKEIGNSKEEAKTSLEQGKETLENDFVRFTQNICIDVMHILGEIHFLIFKKASAVRFLEGASPLEVSQASTFPKRLISLSCCSSPKACIEGTKDWLTLYDCVTPSSLGCAEWEAQQEYVAAQAKELFYEHYLLKKFPKNVSKNTNFYSTLLFPELEFHFEHKHRSKFWNLLLRKAYTDGFFWQDLSPPNLSLIGRELFSDFDAFRKQNAHLFGDLPYHSFSDIVNKFIEDPGTTPEKLQANILRGDAQVSKCMKNLKLMIVGMEKKGFCEKKRMPTETVDDSVFLAALSKEMSLFQESVDIANRVLVHHARNIHKQNQRPTLTQRLQDLLAHQPLEDADGDPIYIF